MTPRYATPPPALDRAVELPSFDHTSRQAPRDMADTIPPPARKTP